MNLQYSHTKLLLILVALSSFYLAIHLFGHSESKYSIVSFLDVSHKGEPKLTTLSNSDDDSKPDEPNFQQRNSDRNHIEQLTHNAARRFGGQLGEPADKELRAPFSPTTEWQEIPEDHTLQPGVQYRVNSSTGKMEARKEDLPETQIPSPLNAITPTKPMDVKEMLLPKEQTTLNTDKETENQPDSSDKMVANKFADEMKDFIQSYKKAKFTYQKVKLLRTLQFELRTLESAEAFVNEDGHRMLVKDLKHEDKFVKSLVALSLGTIATNHLHLKTTLVKDDCLLELINVLKETNEYIVRLPVIFAIHQLVRRYPDAQKVFVDANVPSILAPLFNSIDLDSQKLQMKVLNMLSDLKSDRSNLDRTITALQIQRGNQNSPILNVLKERYSLYEKVLLEKEVVDDKYCKVVHSHFEKLVTLLKMKIVHFMHTYKSECSKEIGEFSAKLDTFKSELEEDLQNETDDLVKEDIRDTLDDIELLKDAANTTE